MASAGSLVQVIRESDISLTCERRGNECLVAGPGDPEYDLLAVWILAVLEQQEYGMDRKKIDHDKPDEDHWVFENGDWRLEKKQDADKKRAEKKKKHDEAMNKLEAKWAELENQGNQGNHAEGEGDDESDEDDRRKLLREYKEELDAIEKEDQDIEKLEAFTKELYGADYDEEVHSFRRRLGSCGSRCDMFCTFFCGGKRRRNLRARIERDQERRAMEAAERQLYFGDNMCVDHTTLKEFLHNHPLKIDTVSPCVNDETWCMLSYPCSI